MSAVTGPSFISYVSEAERDFKRDQKLAEAMNRIHQIPVKELEGRLLPGEIAIGHANKVIRYNVHDDPTRGISGTLVCTNFRLIFISAEKATYDLIELPNRLVNENDVLLNNIENIFVEYPSKRKKLVPGSKVKDNIQRLELYCKDFRVAAFNFKLTVKGEEKGVITSLLHHSYPQIFTRLFAFDYKHCKDASEVCKVPLYRNQTDWEDELRRCSAPKNKWRVSVINEKFTAMPTMSQYFVVPSSVNDDELSKAGDQFTGNRIPIWCWTDSSGCSLVRASTLRPEVEQLHFEDKLHRAVRDADPKQRPVEIVNVSKSCPSCLQLQQSFNKLKAMCMPASENDFWEADSRWPACASKWLQHVSTVLSVSKEAAQSLREKKQNVIVQETGGVDLSSVVTSLIQLILDPTCRTLDGFQSLIQREWVVAGHPFLDRLGHLLQPTKRGNQLMSVTVDGDTAQLAPVFLLFLDCVYQLMVQFPARFEASVTFLTVLYDMTRMTVFDTFIFNNERQRHKSLCVQELYDQPFAVQEVDRVPSTQFLPVWAWEAQFNASDMTLFNNPLYKMRTMQNYRKYVEESTYYNGKKSISPDGCLVEDSKKEHTTQLNGVVPDSIMGFTPSPRELGFVSNDDKTPKNLFHGSKKRTEEHRKNIEKDFPIPQKVGQKSDRMEENRKIVKSGSVGERSKKNPYKATPGGHYPKIALMPKQRSSVAIFSSVNIKPEHHPRSKSDSECSDDNSEVKEQNDDDYIFPHLTDDVITESSRNKIRTRFSLGRKKRGSSENGDSLNYDVPTYRIKLQNKTMQSRSQESNVHALYPATNIGQLKLWRQCYFRWLPWSQIYGGGPASILQQESLLFDEIHMFHNKIQVLKRQMYKNSTNHHSSHGEEDFSPSGVFFSHSHENLPVFENNSPKSSSQISLNLLSSYFPYSPIKELRNKSTLGTPMSNFLQSGSTIFNFGRIRTKHARTPSNVSIIHSLSQSIGDILIETVEDGSGDVLSKSLEDLTGGATQGSNIRDRTHSEVPSRARLKLLDPGVVKPRKSSSEPLVPPTKENVTHITSL